MAVVARAVEKLNLAHGVGQWQMGIQLVRIVVLVEEVTSDDQAIKKKGSAFGMCKLLNLQELLWVFCDPPRYYLLSSMLRKLS